MLRGVSSSYRFASRLSLKVSRAPVPGFWRALSQGAQASEKATNNSKEQPNYEYFPCLRKLKNDDTPLHRITSVYGEEIKGFKTFKYDKPFEMKMGGSIEGMEIVYETWGELNHEKDNAILLHTGLSASSHARSHEDNTSRGWWEPFIGPGAALNTDKYFVICTNVLGGCFGSSGPSSINPQTGKPYGSSFPLVSVEDMVRSQFLFLDHLGIDKLHASIGSSLGGMQSVCAATLFPDRVGRVVSISGALKAHPTAVALRFIQRRILMSDPNWLDGYYYSKTFPKIGMQNARALGTVTYRSSVEWQKRFRGRRKPEESPNFCADFEVEHYVEAQGEKFCTSYDPNSLLYVSKAMDLYDVSEGYPSTVEALKRIKCPVLVIGVVTDILFPVEQQREMAQLLKESGNEKVVYFELNSIHGHDTFMIDYNSVGSAVKGHIESTLFFKEEQLP